MDKSHGLRICALIAAYDEEATVGSVVEQVRVYLPSAYVIDDGSSDRTAKKALDSGAHVLRHADNQGKGRALRTGFAAVLEAGYDAVLTLDADGQHDPADVPRFLECLASTGADIILGARVRDRDTMPFHRRLNNGLVTTVGRWLSGCTVLDFQCGFRLITTRVLRGLPVETTGYELEAELLIQAGRLGYRMENVPISAIYRGGRSHVVARREMLRFTRLLFRSLATPMSPHAKGSE